MCDIDNVSENVSVRLEDSLAQRLRVRARAAGETLSDRLRRPCTLFVDHHLEDRLVSTLECFRWRSPALHRHDPGGGAGSSGLRRGHVRTRVLTVGRELQGVLLVGGSMPWPGASTPGRNPGEGPFGDDRVPCLGMPWMPCMGYLALCVSRCYNAGHGYDDQRQGVSPRTDQLAGRLAPPLGHRGWRGSRLHRSRRRGPGGTRRGNGGPSGTASRTSGSVRERDRSDRRSRSC